MARSSREWDSDDMTTTPSSHNAVFIDTNLDTHFTVTVSDTDSVSDLKRKIMIEHPKCFPNFGEIKILALKVKRKRSFYHLSDSMLVKSAFEGAKKSWFLSVDASSLQQQSDNQFSGNPSASNQLALVCITNTPSGDRNNHLSDTPMKRLLPPAGSIEYMNHEISRADHSAPGDCCNEVSKDLEMEVNLVTNDLCKYFFSNAKHRSDFEMDKYDLLSEGNKIPEACSEHRDGYSKVRVNDVQGYNSPEVSLRTGPASKKKCKLKKKKNEVAVSNCIVEDNKDLNVASDIYASQAGIVGSEFLSGNPGKVNDIEMANMDVGKEPCKTSFTDTNMRPDSGEIPRTHVECRNDEIRNTSGDGHCIDSLVASKSQPKKKRKRESKEAESPSNEHKTLPYNFSMEISKAKATIPENPIEKKLETTAPTINPLSTEPPEDAQLANPKSGKKKKRKNILPRDKPLAAEPPSLHDVGEGSFKGDLEFVAKESDKASDVAIVSEPNVQHAKLPGIFDTPKKQKHLEPVQEEVEWDKVPSASTGIDASGPDAANEEGKSDAPEPGAGSRSKARKKSTKHHSSSAKEFHPLVANELNTLKKGVTHSGHGHIVPDDHKIESSHRDKIEVQRELSQNRNPEVMLSECECQIQGEAGTHLKAAVASAKLVETNTVMESGKSGGSKRMKMGTKKSVTTMQAVPNTELADNSVSGISSSRPRLNNYISGEVDKGESILSQTKMTKMSKPKTVDTSFIGANGESDDLSGSEAESLPLSQVLRNQEDAKKAKQDRSSDGKDFVVKEHRNEVESFQLNQINMTPKNAENMDEKSRKKTKRKHDSATKSLPDLPINEPGVGHGDIIPDNHKIESNHHHKIEGRRELPQNRIPEVMLSEMYEHQIQGEAAVDSAKLVETNTVMESGKSGGSKRMKMGTKKSVTTMQAVPNTELADNSVSGISSLVPRLNNYTSDEADKGESILSQTKMTEMSKPRTVDTSFVGANGESDDLSGSEAKSLPLSQVIRNQEDAKKAKQDQSSDGKDFLVIEHRNEVESFQLNQSNMTPKNAENMDEKSRKKTKRKQDSAAKSLPDLPINEQGVGGEELTSSAPSRTKRKIKSVKTSSKNQLTGQELELNNGNELGSFHPQQNLRTVDSTHIPSSDTHEGNSIRRSFQWDVDDNAQKKLNMIDSIHQTDVSQRGDNGVNFKDYFVPVENKHAPGDLVVDKVIEAKRSDREVKAKRNAKKLFVPSSATSPELHEAVKSNVNQGSERRSLGVKAPDSQTVEQIKTIPQESKQPNVVNSRTGSAVPAYRKENCEPSTATGSSSHDKSLQNRKKEAKRQSSLDPHHVTVSKASNKKMGEVVNISRHEKSLLATPGAIFRDGSSESSDDEIRAVDSDSSTKTPSDNSSSSGSSDGESKSSLDSPRNGTHGAEAKDGGKSIIRSQASAPRNITMDMILKSSSRFKKAKLIATQSQLEDSESQPVDFVPDSQANL